MYYLNYFIVFVVGIMFGSFLNAWIWRTRENISVMNGRSMCPCCRQKIMWYDNIPLISWHVLKMKCRHCNEKISWQYPLVEFAVGLLFVLMVYFNNKNGNFYNLEAIRDCIIVFFLVFIFVYDLKYKEIHDKVTLPLSAILYFVSIAVGWHTWQSMIVGIVVGAGFFLAQYVLSSGKWIGGGDIRLGLLMGVILGWPNIIVGLMLAYILGASISVFQVLFKKKNLNSETPFGTYLTIGTFITMIWGDKLINWYLQLLK